MKPRLSPELMLRFVQGVAETLAEICGKDHDAILIVRRPSGETHVAATVPGPMVEMLLREWLKHRDAGSGPPSSAVN